jgi:tetratricopeptide (TPR) repeat protein
LQNIIQKAKKHLNVALEHNPQHIPSVLLLSDILFEEQKYDQVQTLIDRIKHGVTGMAEINYLQSKLFFIKQNYAEAFKFINKAISKNPSHIESYRLGADICSKANDQFHEIRYLEKIIDLEPLNGGAHVRLSKLITDPTDCERKKLLLEISVDLLPHSTEPIWELAQLHLGLTQSSKNKKGREDQNFLIAEKYMQHAISLDPKNRTFEYQLAQSYFFNDFFEDAEQLFLKLFKINFRKKDCSYFLGLIKVRKQENQVAKNFFLSALGSQQYNPEVLLEVAKIKAEEKHYKEAIKTVEQAIVTLEEKEHAKGKLSKSLSLENKFYDARKKLGETHKLRKLRSDALVLKFLILKSINKTHEKGLLLDAVKVYSANYHAYFHLGEIELIKGNLENSKHFFLKARNVHWSESEIHYNLALIEIDLRNIRDATLHLHDTLEINDRHRKAKNLLKKLGESYRAKNQ